jgi:hypothetical protein
MQGETKRLTYNIEEAGDKLGLGRNASYEAARTGQIAGVPVIRVGKRMLVPRVAFDRLLETGRVD